MKRLLIADDHPLFLDGLNMLLKAQLSDIEIVLTTDFNGVETHMNKHNFNLVLLDRVMPGMFGMTKLPGLKQKYPSTPIAIISASESSQHIRQALDAGAVGFIPKTSAPQEIVQAINNMLSGMPFIPSQAWQDTPNLDFVPDDMQITDRQAEILKLIAGGMSNKIIAGELQLSEGTIKQHINKLFKILKVTNRTQATQIARDLGLIK